VTDDFDPNEFERELQELFAREEEENPAETPDEDTGGEEDEPPADEPAEGEVPDDADGVEGGEDTEGDDTPPPAPPAEPETVRVGEREMSIQDAQALVEFSDWVRANPEKAVAIDAYLRGQAEFRPVEVEPQAPAQPPLSEETLEDLDPAVRQRLETVDVLQQRLDALQAQQTQANQAQFQAAVQRGADNIKDKYALTDEEVQELQVIGAGMNVLPGIAQQRGDYVSAVEETLELAYWQTEKFRDAAVARYSAEQAEAEKRKRKASSISGGSGSVPRGPKAPSTKEDRREAMVQAITQAMTET
jgi:vacuolar-type H+-ATPase subunit I/STV1